MVVVAILVWVVVVIVVLAVVWVVMIVIVFYCGCDCHCHGGCGCVCDCCSFSCCSVILPFQANTDVIVIAAPQTVVTRTSSTTDASALVNQFHRENKCIFPFVN